MRPNRVRQILKAGGTAYGVTLGSASPLVAEVAGHMGYDWVMVDLQHGENNLGNLAPMLTAISATSAIPWVRVHKNESALIQRVVDLGAYGVVVPLVNTAQEAAAAVRSLRYPPRGERSWGPVRGALYGGSDYFDHAEAELQLVVMIETEQGIRNVREIFEVDGVDGCLIGTNDFSLAHAERPRPEPDTTPMSPRVEESVQRVIEAARATGKAPGLFTSDAEMIKSRVRQGFRIISMPGEVGLFRRTGQAMLRDVRQADGAGEAAR